MDRFVSKRLRLDPATAEINADVPRTRLEINLNWTQLLLVLNTYLMMVFFKVLTMKGKQLSATCLNRQKVVNGSTSSSGNFLSHVKSKCLYFYLYLFIDLFISLGM